MLRKSRCSLGLLINGGRSRGLAMGRAGQHFGERREDVLLGLHFRVERMKSEVGANILCFVSETGGKAICFEDVGIGWAA